MAESDSQATVEVPDNAWAVILAALRFYEDDITSRDGGNMARTASDMIKEQHIGEQPQETRGQHDRPTKQATS